MKIVSFQYSLIRKTLEIYTAGCKTQCPGCHNYELWDFNLGSDYRKNLNKIEHKIKTGMVQEVWILGGNPTDNPISELLDLIKFIKKFNVKIWLWTSLNIDNVDDRLKKICDYIKCGEYRENCKSYIDNKTGVKLASPNQKIYEKNIHY